VPMSSDHADERTNKAGLRRILMLCHEFPPIGGGAAAVCAALAREYAAAGHATTVVTMGFGELAGSQRIAGSRVLRIPCGRKRKEMASPAEALLWVGRAWPIVQRLHQADPFDFAHAHFILPAGAIAERLKRAADVPFIITAHGSDVPGYNRERLKLAHTLVRPWWRRICRRADRLVSPSASLLNMIRRHARGAAGMVIPNGFSPGRFRPLARERRILLCSRLVERKGFHYFLEAIADLDLKGWSVDVVGDGPMRGRLTLLAQACRAPVRMHGWIDNDSPELAELYGRAMIAVLPSEWENFSIALLEAMSAGCAVITTNISGNPEAIGEAGRLVPPRNIAALRQAVVELAADDALCQELGEAARRRAVGLFAWPSIAARYLEVLRSIRAHRRGPPVRHSGPTDAPAHLEQAA